LRLAELVGGRGAKAESKSGGATESGAGATIETGPTEAEGGVDPEPLGSGLPSIVQEAIGGGGAAEEPGRGTAPIKETIEGLLGGR
jgi:hypothetical protein